MLVGHKGHFGVTYQIYSDEGGKALRTMSGMMPNIESPGHPKGDC